MSPLTARVKEINFDLLVVVLELEVTVVVLMLVDTVVVVTALVATEVAELDVQALIATTAMSAFMN